MDDDRPAAATAERGKGAISTASATAIGVGGMMGAGLYALVGLASTTAGVWIPLAFLIGGVVSLFSVYSYAKLGGLLLRQTGRAVSQPRRGRPVPHPLFR